MKPCRKVRLVVDVTFSHPLPEGKAATGMQLLLNERADLHARPLWSSEPSVYVEKMEIKRRSRAQGKWP